MLNSMDVYSIAHILYTAGSSGALVCY